LGSLFLVILTSGCTGGSSSPPPQSSHPIHDLRLELHAGIRSPSALLLYGSISQEPSQGSFCWSHGNVEQCSDAALSTPSSAIEIPGRTRLRPTGDAAKVQAAIGRLVDGKLRVIRQLDLSGGQDRIDVPPGDYVLDVYGTWPQGESSFDFHIRVS